MESVYTLRDRDTCFIQEFERVEDALKEFERDEDAYFIEYEEYEDVNGECTYSRVVKVREKRREYNLMELGFFTEEEAKKIVELTNGKTYMNFEVTYSNVCSNCIIHIATNYTFDVWDSEETIQDEAMSFFYSYLIRTLLGKEK